MKGRDTPPGEGSALSPLSPGIGSTGVGAKDADWEILARDAYHASTNWLNASRRSAWGDSLRMFQGRHVSGSKYHSSDYRYRTRLFRPKTRSVVRKNEAATAQAFFSTNNIVSVHAQNEDDPAQLASAKFKEELLNYRLRTSIPWFLTVLGARQDCDVYGVCVSRQYWKYEEKLIGEKQAETSDFASGQGSDMGQAAPDTYQYYQVVSDHPAVELIAPDNFRFDPACDWMDPVSSSPYLIHRIPMYVGEVRRKMEGQGTDPAEWRHYDDGAILSSNTVSDDATRLTRDANRQDPRKSQPNTARDFDVAWVHLVTMRWKGTDYVYYTLGPDKLLTDPRSHVEVYGTEKRPYRIGITNLETHRNYPASNVELGRDLQSQANETVNLRLDALKLALQPQPKVKAGSPAASSLGDFRIFMPGKPITVNAADDVSWDRPPDPSAGSLAEQDRINQDFDELAGSFSQASVGTANNLNETVGGMELIAGAAGSIGELQLELFKQTWVTGVLEDLLDLEERLEEDEMVIALAGAKAQLVQKYSVNRVDDWLMSQKVTCHLDVGIGATNPQIRLNNMMTAASVIEKLFGEAAGSGLVWDEVCSEVFGALGFSDGKRFFVPGFDPHVAQQQLNQSSQQQPLGVDPNKMQEVQLQAQTTIQKTEMETASQERIAAMKNTPPGVKFAPETLQIEQFRAENAARIAGIKSDSDRQIAAMNYQKEREAQAAETQRALIDARTKASGHVITAIPALSKVISDHRIGMAAARSNG
jgi:hypothetical protein